MNFKIYASLFACCFIGVFVSRIFNFGEWEQLLNDICFFSGHGFGQVSQEILRRLELYVEICL